MKNGAFHTVAANTALALYAADYSDNLEECKMAAEYSILSGAAMAKLNELKGPERNRFKNYFNIKDFTLKMNFLTEILNTKKDEISDLKKRFSFNSFREMEFFNRQPLSFYNDAISGKAISIIAEIKKASPSKGIIREDFNLNALKRIAI